MEKIVTQVYKTDEYEKFKFMEGNRNIDLKHLVKLTESFRTKQLPIPIIVNKNYEILEGQHRYLVCKTEELPLYYMIIEDSNIEDAILINTTSKKWTMNDYLDHYCALGKQDYIKLKEFMDITGLNCATARMFAEVFTGKVSKNNNRFSTGNFEMINFEEAFRKFEIYKDYNMCPAFNMQIFIMAVLRIINNEKYDHKRMMSKLNTFYYKVTKRATKNEYIQLLTEIYNYNVNRDNKVYFYITE